VYDPQGEQATPLVLEAAVLDELQALHEAGLTLTAFERARQMAPLGEWRGTRARILAHRILEATGAPRQGARMIVETWRADRRSPEACFQFGLYLLLRRGPLAALEFIWRSGTEPDGPNWHALQGLALAQVRDFDAADAALQRAEEGAPGDSWVKVCRARLCEALDRYPDALEAAEEAQRRAPDYPPAIAAVAHCLRLLNRDLDALRMLQAACGRLQSAALAIQLGGLQGDLDRHADARASFDRAVELSPSMELGFARWLCGARSDAALRCGDVETAITLARACGGDFYPRLAARLEKNGEGPRVCLPVPFVRQHYKTCVPATLAAIGKLWDKPTDHLQVAEEICYDGTSKHSERRWAEDNGWATREFTVTGPAARALLDRGIAFSLSTVEPANAHMQAVIGYDRRKGVLLLRDPFLTSRVELDEEAGLAHYASTGPRGMALWPKERPSLLDGVDLPDAGLYDLLHSLDCALQVHDREKAEDALGQIVARDGGHLLALEGRRMLAAYDSDPLAALENADASCKRFPQDVNHLLQKVASLRELGRRAELRALLEENARGARTDPLLWCEIAFELKQDPRQHDRVAWLARRTLRARPSWATAYQVLADVRWEQNRREEALRLYWFAACLEERNEGRAMTFFLASRALRRSEDALRVLRSRFERFGTRSGSPAQTLFRALHAEQRVHEGLSVLDRAIELRPGDPQLLLLSAQEHARVGGIDRAQALLTAAAPVAKESAWHRAAAVIETHRPDQRAALDHWRAVERSEPLATDAHEAIAVLSAQLGTPQAALEHFAGVCARFPHHYRLRQLWLGWLRNADPAKATEVARGLCNDHPDDSWARRELAISLHRAGRKEETLEELRIAERLEPRSPTLFAVRGQILENAHAVEEAREQYRQSLRLDVDQAWTLGALLGCCQGRSSRRAEIDFLRGEVLRQAFVGGAPLELQREGRDLVPHPELLSDLTAVRKAHPQQWESWSACIRQLLAMDRLSEALALATEAVQRFPLLAAAFIDLAAVHAARKDDAAHRQALDQARKIQPGWFEPIKQLVDAYTREGDFAAAKALLERAVEAAPLSPVAHGYLSWVLWELGEKDPAVERLKRGLRLDPDYEWARGRLGEWLGPVKACEICREFAREQPWRTGAWLGVAAFAPTLDERLEALQQAENREPRRIEIHDQRAVLLAQAGRFDQAMAACAPPAFAQAQPVALRGRLAWILALRGDRRAAIARMRELVASEPGYAWGINCLIDWFREEEDAAGLLEAATLGCEKDPSNAYMHASLGEARLRHGHRASAKAALRKAVELDPGHRWSALTLLDLQIADSEIAEASVTLERLEKRRPGPLVSARALRIALEKDDRTEVDRRLRAICADESEGEAPLRSVASKLASAGDAWASLLAGALERALERPDPGPTAAGAVWAEQVAARRPFYRLWPRLKAMRRSGDAGWRATEAYLHLLAGRGRRLRLLLFLVFSGGELHGRLSTWAAAGYALVSTRAYRRAHKWLKDYAARSPEPWMMVNAIVSLQALRMDDQADSAVDFALALQGAPEEAALQLWGAFRKALAKDPAGARAILDGCKAEADLIQKFLRQATLAVAFAADASRTPAEAFRAARNQMSSASSLVRSPLSPLLRAIHGRAVSFIARRRGGLAGALWGAVRRALPVNLL
jgi:tetratricopeptide (TPR) repeat protein